jgi:hypothetical protein
LVYRSVTFNADYTERKEKDLVFTDNHHLGNKNKGDAIILKMTQRFGLDPDIPAEE